ncbi:unnamed protein product, partial [Didymodactylos carnosus]
MVWTVKQNCDQPEDGLSSDESASIMLYSMEWAPTEKSFYLILNSALRSENRQELIPWFSYLRLITTAFTKLPSTVSRTVYRGVKIDLRSQYPKGKQFVWWGFSLCTARASILDHFLGKTGTRTIFNIDYDTGKDIHKHSIFRNEDEVLLLAARNFEVIRSVNKGDGLHIIELKEIKPRFPLISLPPTPVPITYQNPTLVERINKCHPFSKMDLSQQKLTDQDMEIIVQQAIIDKQCTHLDLCGNEITSQGASFIAEALYNNTTLKSLSLSGNHVSDVGLRYLTQPLSLNNSTLETLALGSNDITDEGAQHLAEMLKKNTTLTELMLGQDKIGDRGIQLLANALAHHNNSLQKLCLFLSELTSDSSVDSLVEMHKYNRSLQKLYVNDCNLSKRGNDRLEALKQSKIGFKL